MKPGSLGATRRAAFLAGILAMLLLVWGFWHRQIHGMVATRMLLDSASPRQEAFFELAKQPNDPVQFLSRFWRTGKIPHRQLVMAFLNANATANPPWMDRAEPLIVAGTADPDGSVRELALAVLAARHSPRLFECAEGQLRDIDPNLRLLGLQYLRTADPHWAAPMVMPLLEDQDLRVAAGAEVALARWSGQDYGVRGYQALAKQDGDPARLDPANLQAIQHGVELRKQWWQAHAKEYADAPARRPAGENLSAPPADLLPSFDFKLTDLNGRAVRLSELRGKIVLLNFWASWCPACLAEIPDLIALQKSAGDRIAIVGIALDGIPDEEGEHEDGQSSLEAIHGKVERAVKARGINYAVWWDPRGLASCQFNGGELPTTVILDAKGRVRRRFLGERSLKVFEAMIAEAQGR